jgi:hypothetical protein
MRTKRKTAKKSFPKNESEQNWVEWRSSAFDQIVEETALVLARGKKKGPVGRPTVRPSILRGRRDDIATLLELEWVHVGWQLHCLIRNLAKKLRSPDNVRIALEPVRGKHGSDRILFLLRPTSIAASSNEVRATWKAFGKAHEKLQTVRAAYQEKVTKFKELWRAYYETSERQRQQLKMQVTSHLANRIRVEGEATEKERFVRSLHGQQKANPELITAKTELEKCLELLRRENQMIRDLNKYLAVATKHNRGLIRQKVKQCLASLKLAKTELQRQTSEEQRLDNLYQDQTAGFARQDFLIFSVEQRGRHHPRHLANALAGLPEMGCRQSYSKCQKIPFQGEPQQDFQVFEVIDRSWGKRSSRKPEGLADLIKKEIEKLPKTREFFGQRAPNYFREYLLANETIIRQAIDECLRLTPRPHPGEVPYIITRVFLAKMSPKPTSALERVLSQTAE